MTRIGQKVWPGSRLKSGNLISLGLKTRRWFFSLTLFQQFAIACTLVLGITMFVLGSWISKRIADGVLHRSAEVGALYMESILEPHVQALATGKTLSAADIATLDGIAKNFALSRHVLSVKVWLADGTVAYSENKELIGRKFDTDEIEPALRGEVEGFLSELEDDENVFEKAMNIPLYEIYAPIYREGTDEVIAVGEFYENAEELSNELFQAVLDNWFVVGGTGLAMILVLFGIVYRGSARIERQHAKLKQRFREKIRLHRANDRLQGKVEDALRETTRIDHQIQRRLGAELHDGPAQLMAFVLLRLDEIEDSLKEGPDAGSKGRNVLTMVRQAAADALSDLRSISTGLFLPLLDDQKDIVDALRAIIVPFENRTGARVEFIVDGDPIVCSAEITQSVCRVTQEALNNSWKHARGSQQRVMLGFTDHKLLLSVWDNGPGIKVQEDATEDHPGLGLKSIKYRIESVGGTVKINSSKELGTEILCEVVV